MLTAELLSELKQIVEEEYGIKLTEHEVSEVGNLLIDIYDNLTQDTREEEDQ